MLCNKNSPIVKIKIKRKTKTMIFFEVTEIKINFIDQFILKMILSQRKSESPITQKKSSNGYMATLNKFLTSKI